MDLKRLITHFTYKVEVNPQGGFIAHPADSSAPALEAPTREELHRKIQANIAAALAAEFPSVKQPLEKKEVKFAFHVEHKPGGGFVLQSTDGNALPVAGSTHAEIENHFVEKVIGALGKRLVPELAQALAAQLGSADIEVSVDRKLGLSTSPSKAGLDNAGSVPLDQSATLLSATNAPITPEPSNFWPIARFILAALILAAFVYFFLHR